MSGARNASDRRGGGLAARLLAPFADVRPREAGTALLLGGQAFVLLAVYYLLKPVRESWILPGGAELKTYLAAIQAVALVGVAKGHEAIARRMRRDRLIALSTAVAVGCLGIFASLSAAGHDVAVAFFLWLGAFQLLLVAQFWSFATDVYVAEQGRRIFPILGAGAAIGSVVGAQVARVAMRELPAPALLVLGMGLLLLVPALGAIAHARESRARRAGDAPPPPPVALAEEGSVLGRVLGDPYLRLVAVLTILLNATTTLGEYVLDRSLLDAAALAVAHHEAVSVQAYVGAFKADYYAATNLVVLFLSLFAVSRVLRLGGERLALLLLPLSIVLFAMASLGALAIGLPMLAVLAASRVTEVGIAHSIQATARQSLYLVTHRYGRWAGRAFIDTVTWRAGDVLGALVVAALAALGAGLAHVLGVVLVLGLGWLVVVRALDREHRALTGA